jgi:hypothetical protein
MMNKMTNTTTSNHLASLFARAIVEPDDERADRLMREYNEAFVLAVRESWGERLRAADALLDQAEAALNAAEATTDSDERHRQLRLFELLMASARSSV